MRRTALFLLAAVVIAASGSMADVVGHSSRAVKRVADPILGDLLNAANQGAFKLAAKDFSPEFQQSLPSSELAEIIAGLRRDHGAYVTHEYLGSLATQGRTTSLALWKAQYERDDVLIRMTLEQRDGRAYVTGLWFE